MKIKSFLGGVHPHEFKELSCDLAFEVMPKPKQVIIPTSQHIGKPAKIIVQKGNEVKAGTLIAEQDGFISSPVYSSVSGKVSKIAMNHTMLGFPKECVFIDTIESDEVELLPKLDISKITPSEIKARVKLAGIVGQGGAAFPTFVKLTPPETKKIDTVILNACECEPYLTRDYRLLLEKPNEVVQGLHFIMVALGVEIGIIGIENNKPKAIEVIKDTLKDYPNIFLEIVKTKYPQGAEKMLIKAVTKREVPPGNLPLDVGVVVQNVGTAAAVYDAIINSTPQLSSALTVSGLGIKNSKNLIVKIGTPLQDIIDFCGGLNDNSYKVVAGGPMMGVALHDFSVPVTKATSGILVLTKEEARNYEETTCLRCGKCIDVCPLFLMPTRLARLSQLEMYEEADKYGITVCMECGSCTYSCPA
ncbi:MAG: electron transport complex subunit RsxC, partial [Ignavibacteriales bacterium]|nr:electron transport complex subunit RsxC [Ignavibacteriales bacterium]